jgi:hypothetical protein
MKYWRKAAWLAALTGVSGALLVLTATNGETKNDKGAIVMATASVRGEAAPCG